MRTKEDFKLISFPEAAKKKARKEKWQNVVNWFKSIFKRKRGFEKYRIVAWGNYVDTRSGWVEVQNLKTGKVQHKRLSVCEIDYETVKIFVGRMK